MDKDIERVTRIVEEVANLKQTIIDIEQVNNEVMQDLADQCTEIESLKAKLAMQAEVLNHVDTKGYKLVKDAINATQSDVDAWIAAHDKKLLDIVIGVRSDCGDSCCIGTCDQIIDDMKIIIGTKK